MKRIVSFTLAIAAGAAAAASITLLVAPKKGSELRSDLREKVQKTNEKANEIKAAASDFKAKVLPPKSAVAVVDETTNQPS